MKPFNLERAKAGDPVRTMNGRKARIICFDMNNKTYPIVALITDDEGEENAECFTNDGRYSAGGADYRGEDLFMASKTITKFVNIYKRSDGKGFYAGRLADSIEQAKEIAKGDDMFVCTQTLSWEE